MQMMDVSRFYLDLAAFALESGLFMVGLANGSF